MLVALVALFKKMKIKLTWKSIIALAALIVSAVSAAMTSHIFPTQYNVALALISGVMLAIERYAEAIDNATAVHASLIKMQGSMTAVTAALYSGIPTVPEASLAVAHAQVDLDHAVAVAAAQHQATA